FVLTMRNIFLTRGLVMGTAASTCDFGHAAMPERNGRPTVRQVAVQNRRGGEGRATGGIDPGPSFCALAHWPAPRPPAPWRARDLLYHQPRRLDPKRRSSARPRAS